MAAVQHRVKFAKIVKIRVILLNVALKRKTFIHYTKNTVIILSKMIPQMAVEIFLLGLSMFKLQIRVIVVIKIVKIQMTDIFLQNVFRIIRAIKFLMIIQRSVTKETFQLKTKVTVIIYRILKTSMTFNVSIFLVIFI